MNQSCCVLSKVSFASIVLCICAKEVIRVKMQPPVSYVSNGRGCGDEDKFKCKQIVTGFLYCP